MGAFMGKQLDPRFFAWTLFVRCGNSVLLFIVWFFLRCVWS